MTFNERARIMHDELLTMTQSAAASKCPLCIATAADVVNGYLYAAEDALQDVVRAAGYPRLTLHVGVLSGDTEAVHSALTDIAEHERDDVEFHLNEESAQ